MRGETFLRLGFAITIASLNFASAETAITGSSKMPSITAPTNLQEEVSEPEVKIEKNTTTTNITVNEESEAKAELKVGSNRPQMFRFNLGPSLTVVANGATLYGGTVGFAARVSENLPLYIGLDTGFSYSNVFSPYYPGLNPWILPIMATAYYRFDIGNTIFHPTAGASAGIAIVGGYLSANLPPSNYSYYNTSYYIEGMLRPGVDIDLAPNLSLSLEPRVGFISSTTPYSASAFVFSPTVMINFGF